MGAIHLFQVLFNSPVIGATINTAKDRILKETDLDPRLRELAIMRAAWLTGAEYVWNHHHRPHVEHDLEVRPIDVLDVREWESAAGFGELERAVLRLTDEMVLEGGASAETVAAAGALLPGDRELVELVAAIAVYRAISTMAVTLAIPMEEGYGSWEPDGVAPS
jgi:alkylhydroperoxidase family enzyme